MVDFFLRSNNQFSEFIFLREKEEEELKEKLQRTKIDVTKDDDDVKSKEPDAVVNLTFDSEGNLVRAEQEKRTQSGKSSRSSQLAVRAKNKDVERNGSASSKSSSRKNSAKNKERESSAQTRSSERKRSGKEKSAKKKVGMKPLSREEQQDYEELQREEQYQRAEQKKIQVFYHTFWY